jgi:hypothetical protein
LIWFGVSGLFVGGQRGGLYLVLYQF